MLASCWVSCGSSSDSALRPALLPWRCCLSSATHFLLSPLLCPGTGNIVRADIVYGRDGRSRGYGTVRYETVEEASAAIEQFNGGCSGQGGHVSAVREHRMGCLHRPALSAAGRH